jgi:hypothetical protein
MYSEGTRVGMGNMTRVARTTSQFAEQTHCHLLAVNKLTKTICQRESQKQSLGKAFLSQPTNFGFCMLMSPAYNYAVLNA